MKEKSLIPAREMATLAREQLQAYAKAARDSNPIHLDESVAKEQGLPSVIAHGMLVAAFCSERALLFLEENHLEQYTLKEFQARFRNMAFPGDTVSVSGVVKIHTEKELHLTLEAKNGELKVLTSVNLKFSVQEVKQGFAVV